VQAALTASGAADAALLARFAASRAAATEAVAAVLRDCIVAGCAGDTAQRAAFGASTERLIAVRHDTDAAMQQPLAGRPPGLAVTWAAASPDVVTRQQSERVLRCLDEFGRAYPATLGTDHSGAAEAA